VTHLDEDDGGAQPWESMRAYSETYTCYSSAIATWAALGGLDWPPLVDTGLHLGIVEADDGLFGFLHFPPGRRRELGLVRRGCNDADEAVAGILDELEAAGRVIVAGDGFQLPWHVAFGRRHVPHWFVVTGPRSAPLVVDPFACRNELGRQEAVRERIEANALETLGAAHPQGDDVVLLRESFALGDDARPLEHARFQWLVRGSPDSRAPDGLIGAAAIVRLARHFREHGRDERAYRQADDIWSIARHRAFLARHAAATAGGSDPALGAWVDEHAAPLAKRWSHLAPLLMQAVLALRAGREPSSSVADTLDHLAALEPSAAAALPGGRGSV
jgi:hypothetical protein